MQPSTEEFWGLQPKDGPPVKLDSSWLYYGGRSIYSVRMPPGTSDEAVRARAMAQHERVPLSFPVAPVEFKQMLRFANVLQFNDGPSDTVPAGDEGEALETERPRMGG